ncbi:MAG: NAD(P)-dependent oxidoreductase [Acidobacteriota bacterium]|nr:NAD(P)-dependent oxidoreductase [Acidobacteriota bacterium]
MRVAVTGAAGHLGAAIVAEFAGHDVTPLLRDDLDITDHAAVDRRMRELRPDAIINCAAYNDVDGAEANPMPALDVNALAVMALARAAARCDAVLVHYGTDFVFDGETDRPYVETDAPCPRSFYGCTKLLGEWFAVAAPRGYVLRVESIFGGPTAGITARSGSLGGIVAKLKAGEEVTVITDRTVSPSYAPDIAVATRGLVEGAPPFGLYHCVNSGAASWVEIAREAAALLGVVPRLRPVPLAALNLRAARPLYCAMNPAKLAGVGVPVRAWQDALREWLARGRS